MGESADFDDAGAIAVSIGNTNLVGTGLAKESGGNLQTARSMLDGTAAGALLGSPGNTIGKEIAAMIAGGSITAPPGGTPVLHGHNQLYSNASQVIAASGSFTPPNIVFTKSSYLMRVTAQMSGLNALMPSVKVNMQWRSSLSGASVLDQQIWYLPAGGGSAMRVNFRGPVLGDTLNVTFSNGDTVDTVTLAINIYEGSFPANRHDVRSNGAVASQGATAIQSQVSSLVIANDTFNVPAGTTVLKNLPLYAGQVNIFINQNAAAGAQMVIVPFGLYDAASSQIIASMDWTAAPHQLLGVPLPRGYCQAQFTNGGGVAVPASLTMTALEYAS